MKNKSVQLSEDCHFELKKISDRLDKNIGEVAGQCILYISKKHIDPFNLKEGNPIEAINRYHDHTMGFITTFEKKKLTPILDNLTLLFLNLRDALATMPNRESQVQMNKHLGEMKTYINHQHSELVKMKEIMVRLENQKETLIKRVEELVKYHNNSINNNKALIAEITQLKSTFQNVNLFVYNSLLEFTENLEGLQLLNGKDKIKALNVAFINKFKPLLSNEPKNSK